mgnify:CR=1 FL=1
MITQNTTRKVRLVLLSLLVSLNAGAATLDKAKMVDLLKGIDIRIRSSGDYKALVYLEQREKDRPDVVREALAYRRDADEKLMILFTKPKTEAGVGSRSVTAEVQVPLVGL